MQVKIECILFLEVLELGTNRKKNELGFFCFFNFQPIFLITFKYIFFRFYQIFGTREQLRKNQINIVKKIWENMKKILVQHRSRVSNPGFRLPGSITKFTYFIQDLLKYYIHITCRNTKNKLARTDALFLYIYENKETYLFDV